MNVIEIGDPSKFPMGINPMLSVKTLEEVKAWGQKHNAKNIWVFKQEVGNTYIAMITAEKE